MALFTMTGETLHDALANVLPHASKDGMLPVLAAIEITVADDGLVTFAATDRYTLAVVEIPSDEQTDLEPGAFLLPRDIAATIAKTGKAARRGKLAVTVDEAAYAIDVRDIAGETSTSARLEAGQFPKWRSLWPEGDPVDVTRIGLGASQLAKFAKVYNHGAVVKHSTLDCAFYGAAKPVTVDVVGVDLRAIVMPVRLADSA